ncbi:hypothetical protein TNCV_1978511 [Trichonephila clavipes]|nr:hypothetical protein TNCV_1978511 [Trichonephila clavipes]
MSLDPRVKTVIGHVMSSISCDPRVKTIFVRPPFHLTCQEFHLTPVQSSLWDGMTCPACHFVFMPRVKTIFGGLKHFDLSSMSFDLSSMSLDLSSMSFDPRESRPETQRGYSCRRGFKRESRPETQRGTGCITNGDRCQTGIDVGQVSKKGIDVGQGALGHTGASDRTRNTTWDQPTPHADVDSKGNPKNNGGIKTGEK